MTDDTTGKDIDPIRKQIGANVRAELARAGMGQAQVSEILGISRFAVGKRLAGEAGFEAAELVRVAAALGVPVARLIEPTAAPAGSA